MKQIKVPWSKDVMLWDEAYLNIVHDEDGLLFCKKCGCHELYVFETEDGDIALVCPEGCFREIIRF